MRRALLVLSVLALALAARAQCAPPPPTGLQTQKPPVVARPDLVADPFVLLPDKNPKPGSPFGSIHVIVRNVGTKESKDCKLAFGWLGSQTFQLQLANDPKFPDEVNVPGVGWVLVTSLPALGPGKGIELTFKAHPSVGSKTTPPVWKQGDYTIICKLDRDNQVVESNEPNNVSSLVVKVRPSLLGQLTPAATLPTLPPAFTKAMAPVRRR